jgi:DNA-directed RNA polymerase specialized sigma24 family protein
LRAGRKPEIPGQRLDGAGIPETVPGAAESELVKAERLAALREAFTDLPRDCQRLITMLSQDPLAPYAEISEKLCIPAESVGPSRSRCLEQLRRHPAIAALINAETRSAAGDIHRQPAAQR